MSEIKDRYFYATIKIYHKNGKDKLQGKFIVVSPSLILGKVYVSDLLSKQYPEYTKQDIKLSPIANVEGMFIYRQPEQQKEDLVSE